MAGQVFCWSSTSPGNSVLPQSPVVNRRSHQNPLGILPDMLNRSGNIEKPLIVTDGFEFYGRAVCEVVRKDRLYAQVIKTLRNNRVVTVENWQRNW